LACNRQKLLLVTLELRGEPDIVRSFLEELGELLAAFDKRFLAQIGSL